MKAKTLILLSAVTFAGLAIAQAPPVYTAVEAGKHAGETATVKDKVDGAYQSAGPHFPEYGPESSIHGLHPRLERCAVLSPAAIRKANPRCLWEDRPV